MTNDYFSEKDDFNILKTTQRFIMFTFGAGVLMTLLIVCISYYQFREVYIEQYSKRILFNATFALSVVKVNSLEGYLNGRPRDRDYDKVYNRLKRFTDEFDLEYTYVCKVDPPDYNKITYIFNPCNHSSTFKSFSLGDVQIYKDKQFNKAAKRVFEGKENVVRYVLHNDNAHITVNVPIIKNDKVIAMLGVRYSIDEFSAASRRYFITINIIVFCTSAIFMAALIKLFGMFLITPMARHNVRLRMASDEAQSATRAKSLFLATMSHEIRTPMNAIVGFTKLAQDSDSVTTIKDHLKKIDHAANTLLKIINDILDFSKIESGKMELYPAPYDIDTLLSDVKEVIQVRVREALVALRIERDSGIPRYLIGDEVRIKQILLNLAGNSAKFTQSGEIVIGVKLAEEEKGRLEKTIDRFEATLPNNKGEEDGAKSKERGFNSESVALTFYVRDTGIGIKSEDSQKVFESFQQVDMEHNRKIEGTGLGLSISKQLVALMGGALNLKSEYGAGCEFSFTIEQKISDTPPDATVTSDIFLCEGASVLVVDDNEVNLEVAKGYLSQYKCKVTTASSGKEAIGLIKNNNFDLIFMDYMMPYMDGVEAATLIRGEEEGTARKNIIILLTAASDNETHNTSLFNGILGKPIEEGALKAIMEKYLKKKVPSSDLRNSTPNTNIASQSITGGNGDNDEKVGETIATTQDNAVLRVFMKQVDKKAALIESLLKSIEEEESLTRYKIEVHSLKSAAKSCGFDKLSDMARDLEAAACDKNRAYIKNETDTLLKEYRATTKNSDTYKRSDTTMGALYNNKEETPQPFTKNYNNDIEKSGEEPLSSEERGKMIKAASAGDIVTLEECAQKVSDGVLRDALLNAIDDIDFEAVKKLLDI